MFVFLSFTTTWRPYNEITVQTQPLRYNEWPLWPQSIEKKWTFLHASAPEKVTCNTSSAKTKVYSTVTWCTVLTFPELLWSISCDPSENSPESSFLLATDVILRSTPILCKNPRVAALKHDCWSVGGVIAHQFSVCYCGNPPLDSLIFTINRKKRTSKQATSKFCGRPSKICNVSIYATMFVWSF